ncbi:hypothetical protein D7X33_20240 [Butyricicoccus sp. 1XD8-22]|nr:hypothetical protein D7X33_20240 [Butyricicoccus sp. 1XD8-22]
MAESTEQSKQPEKTSIWKNLFGGKKEGIQETTPKIDDVDKNLYEQLKKRLEDISPQEKSIRELLAAAKERKKLKKSELQKLIEEGGNGDFIKLGENSALIEQILSLNTTEEQVASTTTNEDIIDNDNDKNKSVH